MHHAKRVMQLTRQEVRAGMIFRADICNLAESEVELAAA